MRWFVGLCLVAACGPKAPPERLVGRVDQLQSPMPHPNRQALVGRAARPAIDISAYVPDFHDELRWPLSGMNHPVLEPRFDVAQELALPGVDWQELCARGVQNRVSSTQKELLAYLHGWCDVQRRDVDSACRYLTPLLGSTTHRLGDAVRQDLANILMDQGDADKAEHWLAKHNIRDIATLDLLAANYAEGGQLADAAAINRRILDSDDVATEATKCRRLTRQIAAEQGSSQTAAFLQLEQLATKPKAPDPLCVRLYHKSHCLRDPDGGCLDFYADEGIDARAVYLVRAYEQWPGEGTWMQWWRIVGAARNAVGMPGADELVVTALEAGVSAENGCPRSNDVDIGHVLQQIRMDPLGYQYESRLKRIEETCAADGNFVQTATMPQSVPPPPRTPRSVTAPSATPPPGATAAEAPVPAPGAPTAPRAAPEPARPGPPPTLAPSTKSITPPASTPTTKP